MQKKIILSNKLIINGLGDNLEIALSCVFKADWGSVRLPIKNISPPMFLYDNQATTITLRDTTTINVNMEKGSLSFCHCNLFFLYFMIIFAAEKKEQKKEQIFLKAFK